MPSEIKQIFRKKIVPVTFERTMGLFGASTIGIGALMGAGLYVLIGMAANVAGPSVWISYVICGGLAFFTTLMFAELAKIIPKSGGGYAYAYDSLGSLGGFATGWFLALGSIFACALYAIGFAHYFASFFGEIPHWQITILALALVVLSTLINVLGANSDRAQIFLTWGNLIILTLLIVVSAFHFNIELVKPVFPKGFSGTLSAISIIYISFFGYQLIANNSDEIKNPTKTVPKAMKLSMMVAFLFYSAIAITAILVIPWQELARSDAPLVVVAEKSFGSFGWILISIGGVLAAASALNSTLLSQSRQIYAMGKNRFFPDVFGIINERRKTPIAAIIGGGALVVVVISTFDIEFITKSATFCLLASMVPISLALRKIYKKYPEKKPNNLVKRFLPEIALITNISLIFILDWISLTFGFQLAIIGALVYFFYSRKRETRSRSGMSITLVEEKTSFLLSGSRILVPMANPKTQAAIFSVSDVLLGENKGEIIALSVVKTPKQIDFYSALSNQDVSLDIMERTAEFSKLTRVPVKSIIRASHNISQGIVHAAVDEKCNLTIMGYSASMGKGTKSPIFDVLQYSHTDIIFLKIFNEDKSFKPQRIGIALGGHINMGLMVNLASSLAEQSQGRITFLSILPKDFTAQQKLKADKNIAEAIQKNRKRVLNNVETFSSDTPLDLLIEQSQNFDLMIIGTTKTGVMQRAVMGSFATEFAERAQCAVAIVKVVRSAEKITKKAGIK